MNRVHFCDPIDGVMFCVTDEQIARGLDRVDCILTAPEGHQIEVNGHPAVPCGEIYTVSAAFDGKITRLTACDLTTGEREAVTVYRIYTPKKTFRVSLDDNIWFLQDIAAHQDTYQSLFENPYLAMYRRLHEEYGAKFHCNIYYTCPEHGGFSLPELSDKFRDEWQSIRDWFALSCHAWSNEPAWIYSKASADTVFHDFSLVNREIERFAGYRNPVTTMHFAECPGSGIKALYRNGIRALLGDYSLDANGHRQICYFAEQHEFDAVRKHCFWRNPKTGMIMFPCDTVLNCYEPKKIPEVQAWFADHYGYDRPFIDILMHEEYFYEDYALYHPDFEDHLRAGIEWCLKNGYTPGLLGDVIDFSDPELFDYSDVQY